ncbi:CAP domain-containing protein [Streptomyces sp. NPDC017949]|uniref:CAP domain-containing protein n=1 Tax=Streptomyces sp. NPDC017949 TaxID=3365020 RepID=UPI003793C00A
MSRSRTPATPSRIDARRKKTVRTRIVLSVTAASAAAAVAVGVAVADSDGGSRADRADGATGRQAATTAPGDLPGGGASATPTSTPASPSPSLSAEAAAATGSLPAAPPTADATGSTGSAAPTKPAAADDDAPAQPKAPETRKPTRTAAPTGGGGTSGGSGATSGGSGGSGGSTSGDSESAVLALVNKERATAGCGPLTANAKLNSAARAYSDTMARSGVMSHTGPDGSTMTSRVEAAGYAWSRLGENIARGQADADAVMKAWMNSSGHRANILNCAFREIGIGVHKGDGGPWWTQNFGAPR